MALTKVIGSGVGTLASNVAVTSDDPTITMTDSSGTNDIVTLQSTSGALIVTARDGSSNGEIIFKADTGSAVTEHMRINNIGAVTKPLQPAFHATPSSTQTNLSNATTIAFGTERFDQNGDFASNTFTAPVTGKYQINVSIGLLDTDSAAAFIGLALISSNKAYYILVDPDYGQDNAYGELALHQLIDMDANDTVYVNFLQNGGTAQTDVHEDHSNFSGYLVA